MERSKHLLFFLSQGEGRRMLSDHSSIHALLNEGQKRKDLELTQPPPPSPVAKHKSLGVMFTTELSQ